MGSRVSTRAFAVCLSAAIMIPLAAGCKPSSKTGTESESSAPSTLSIEIFDRGTQGNAPVDNNWLTQYVQEKFGTPNSITVKYVAVPRSQETDKLNVMMAASNAPDICFTYTPSLFHTYADQGGLTDLTAAMNKYGAALKKYLGSDVLKAGVINSKQMSVPAIRGSLAMTCPVIRQDWLDKLSMKVPTTTQELYDFLVAVKQKDPGGLGSRTIPMGIAENASNSYETTYDDVLQSFLTKMSAKERATLPFWKMPGAQNGMQFMNKLYNEGLLSPDFALDKDGTKLTADMSNGRVGFAVLNVNTPFYPNGIEQALEKNVPGASYVPCDPFTNYENKHVKKVYNPFGMFIMVPKFSKSSVQAVKYLNWMSDPKVMMTLNHGEENVDYTLNSDGVAVGTNNSPADHKLNFGDYVIIGGGGEYTSQKQKDAALTIGQPYPQKMLASVKISTTDGFTDYTFQKSLDSQTKYAATLNVLNGQLNVKCITAKTGDFASVFSQSATEYMNAGGQAVMEEMQKEYDAENSSSSNKK